MHLDRPYRFGELYRGTFAALNHIAVAVRGVPARERRLKEAEAINDILLKVYGGDVGERRLSDGSLPLEEPSALIIVETFVDLFTGRM